MVDQQYFPANEFNTLKAFLRSEKEIPIGFNEPAGLEAHKNLLAERLHPNMRPQFSLPDATHFPRISAKPAAYLSELITFLRSNKIFSKTFNSEQVRNDLEANTSITTVRELVDSFKELEKSQNVMTAIAERYSEPSELTEDDVVRLKMAHYALGTMQTICRALQTQKENMGHFDEAEAIGITIAGIRQFRNELNKSIPERRIMTL